MVRKKPEKPAVTESVDSSDDNEDRTEVRGEYKGGKIRVLFGRHGAVLVWSIAWAVAILSTVLAAGMVATIIENLKRIGVL